MLSMHLFEKKRNVAGVMRHTFLLHLTAEFAGFYALILIIAAVVIGL